MSNFARIEGGKVAELFSPPAGLLISDCFNAALLWVDVTNVSPQPAAGWTASHTSGSWVFAAPAATAVTVPALVSNFQARAVLMGLPGATTGKTLLDDVNAWVAAQGGLAYQAWEYGVEVRRDSALIAAAGTQFNLSSAQLDAMFVTAATILA